MICVDYFQFPLLLNVTVSFVSIYSDISNNRIGTAIYFQRKILAIHTY